MLCRPLGLDILAAHTSRRYSLDVGSSAPPSGESVRDLSALLRQRPPGRSVRPRTAVSGWRSSLAEVVALLQRRGRTLQGAPATLADATAGTAPRQSLSESESTFWPQI